MGVTSPKQTQMKSALMKSCVDVETTQVKSTGSGSEMAVEWRVEASTVGVGDGSALVDL